MSATVRAIIRNCGIEKSIDLAHEAYDKGISHAVWVRGNQYQRRTINTAIALMILKELSELA